MVYATAPHIKIKNLKLGLKLIKNKKTKFIFPASEIKKRNKNGFFVNNNLNIINKATKLSAKHLDSGQFYWGRVNTWLKNKSVFIKNSKIIKIPHSENIDLNTKNDLAKLNKIL
jgi:N-acylneuraminate cytidylyltransferase